MLNEKTEKISELAKIIETKLTPNQRNRMTVDILGSIICVMGKSLAKIEGYSVVATVLQREMRKIGKEDAPKFLEIYGKKEVNEEAVKDVLRIAAMILGAQLGVYEDGIGLAECPFCELAKKFDEPFITNACLEYSNGILEGMVGDKFTLVESKKRIRGDAYCKYTVIKRI